MTYLTTVLADAPLHYWRMADPGGGIAHDIGSTRRALLGGAGQAQFAYTGPNTDGGSGFFESNSAMWDLDTEVLPNVCSIEVWVWQHYRRGANQDIIAFTNGAGVGNAELRIGTTGLITFFNAAVAAVGVTVMTTQHWHHLVGVQTGALAKVYLDGVQDASIASVAAGTLNTVKSTGGQDSSGNLINSASAQLAECAYYNYALTAAQVAAHFAAADAVSSTPQYRPFGTVDLTSGSPTFAPDDTTAILNSVRHTV